MIEPRCHNGFSLRAFDIARAGMATGTLAVVLALALAACSQQDRLMGGDAFFARHFDTYATPENLKLMPQGKVLIEPHGLVDISDFTWSRPEGWSNTLMLDMEELTYLLPFVGSNQEDDRAFAVKWYRGWARAHTGRASPNPSAWDAMTTGVRAAFLACFLECERARRNGGISVELLESLREHRTALREMEFNINSNHGVWHAIGLMEVGRALDDADTFQLGLTRLEELVAVQVSPAGFHKEHAPKYHFLFLRWLDESITYLKSLPGVDGARLAALREVCDRMKDAGYFLQDSDGDLLPIGDTFCKPVFSGGTDADDPARDPVRFDPDAGYACFREPSTSGFGRQVVFSIQSSRGSFPWHMHDDALAVVVSYGGELLLGDQGAYAYAESDYRRYFVSRAAHNSISPGVKRLGGQFSFAADPSYRHDGGAVIFAARRAHGGRYQCERTVVVPDTGATVEIVDQIDAPRMVMLWNFGADVDSIRPETANDAGAEAFDRRWILVSSAGRTFEFQVESQDVEAIRKSVIYRGAEDPMLGWYSPEWEVAVPSPVLFIEVCAREPVSVRTTLRPVDGVE